jgi:hypothetical protein
MEEVEIKREVNNNDKLILEQKSLYYSITCKTTVDDIATSEKLKLHEVYQKKMQQRLQDTDLSQM